MVLVPYLINQGDDQSLGAMTTCAAIKILCSSASSEEHKLLSSIEGTFIRLSLLPFLEQATV